MDLQALRVAIVGFVEVHKVWTAAIAGVLGFLGSIAFLSLLVPAPVILIGIGATIGMNDIPFWPVVAAAAVDVDVAAGDRLSYEFGRYYGEDATRLWPMRGHTEMVARGESFLKRWGATAVAVGRFVGPARAVVPLIAGVFGVTRLPFQAANVISALAWAFALPAPGAGLLAWFRD